MKKILFSLLSFGLSLGLCLTAAAHSYDLNARQVTTFSEIIADLRLVQVVFIGEMHGVAAHHSAQLQVIKALHDGGTQVSIGLEMFRQDGQEALDRWVAGDMDEFEFGGIFLQNWSNWHAYRDIFIFARDKKIPLRGLNIPREIVRQVAREGFDSLSDGQQNLLPLTSCNVSPEYRDFIRRSLQGHADNGSAFEHFCEAQILWDASMAEKVAEYLQQHPQRLVVVLAGNGHSWKHGIDEQLSRIGTYRTRVLLPEVPGRIDLLHIDSDDADYLLQGVELGPLH